ncbi:hypothetical protein SAMN05216268_11958 [Streptomyces yunnanensis]|uniref:Uncharacterized protein n=1 Tax=Streptomyces yunnanensis TaxID=156453 RepID=A0A9X8QYG5_9ACTN|nr:hypothetical protein SAMN05216268_11958 [Streptomyces yunnanensis]
MLCPLIPLIAVIRNRPGSEASHVELFGTSKLPDNTVPYNAYGIAHYLKGEALSLHGL